jgi:integrase/recombinase XerD
MSAPRLPKRDVVLGIPQTVDSGDPLCEPDNVRALHSNMQLSGHSEQLPDTVTAWRNWQTTTCGNHTIHQRADAVARLAEWVAARRGVPSVDPRYCGPDDVAAYLARPQLGANSRATYYRALSSWFGWLHQSGRTPNNPLITMRAPKSPDDDPDPLTAAEVDAVFIGTTGRLRAVLSLGLYAGLRVHEAAKFRGDWIRDRSIRIPGKGSRTAVIPLADQLAVVAVGMPLTWWFPSPLKARNHLRSDYLTTLVSEHFRDRGVYHGSFHRLRHTYGTLLQEEVGDTRVVQQMMRHRSIVSTQRYTRVADTRMRDALGGLPPLSA